MAGRHGSVAEDAPAFVAWFARHRPDAIATCYIDARAALEAAGVRVPQDVGLALNWRPPENTAAGVQQKTVQLRGRWIEGDSVRPLRGR